jgi:hypothetical protein
MRTSSEWQTIEVTALDHRMARLRYFEPVGSRKMGADGTGKTCACGLPTSTAGIEYEVDMADRRTFRFHEPCVTMVARGTCGAPR